MIELLRSFFNPTPTYFSDNGYSISICLAKGTYQSRTSSAVGV